MRRVITEGVEVRIEDDYPPAKAEVFLQDPERHRGPLSLWRTTLRHVAAAVGMDRHFEAGFILDDGRMALTADGEQGAVVCINPDRYVEAITKYGREPLSLAAFLHSIACHELAHLDGRMGHGHDEEFIAAREEIGAATAMTIPKIAELAACTLGLGPCPGPPTKFLSARQEALRACEEVVAGRETEWTARDLCQAAADPLDAAVESFVHRLLDLKPGGLSEEYITGFAARHVQKLRSIVAPLLNGDLVV